MICRRCGKRQAGQVYCRPCFLDIIEKRLRKHLRSGKVKMDDRILVMDPVSGRLLKNLGAKAVIKKPKSLFGIRGWDFSVLEGSELISFMKKQKIDRTMLPLTIDDELAFYLEGIFSGRKFRLKKNPKIMTLPFTGEELALFCRYKKLRLQRHSSDIHRFLDRMEHRFPGTKFSFYRAYQSMNG